MAGSAMECMSVMASLCDFLSKQGSDGKCGEIKAYKNKWDITYLLHGAVLLEKLTSLCS
jgi:hypothetical protein